jgi:hypothetical protein
VKERRNKEVAKSINYQISPKAQVHDKDNHLRNLRAVASRKAIGGRSKTRKCENKSGKLTGVKSGNSSASPKWWPIGPPSLYAVSVRGPRLSSRVGLEAQTMAFVGHSCKRRGAIREMQKYSRRSDSGRVLRVVFTSNWV